MDLLDFGKYNFHIWVSYAFVFLVLVLNIIIPYLQNRALIKKLRSKKTERKY